ncbi:GAF domain-containing protein [Lentzea albidocapillata subsp. violacea]|uniref:GAF domain-containing protein n=1 Tax=Lentzea albidocapillata subsp. violacea TaxID=128104 RepID=A0A1G8UC71_9PSEU|nr:GAF and ANTAR domain-containing protein [Lentzea albidocapillata]SDJ50590.1 GAF domain-containing protein [Lentzea albidocapillata subsp. violacea]
MDDLTIPPSQDGAPDAGAERQDPVERLDDATDALMMLRDGFSGEEPLDEVLQRLSETATRAVQDADAVTVTVNPEQPRTAAASVAALIEIDEKQYSSNRGPCLEAARTLRAVRAVVGGNGGSWPEFDAAAEQHGVRAYLSVPILLPAADHSDAKHVGSLNLYSYNALAFDPFDEGVMRLFTTAASAAIDNAHRWQRSRDHITHLETALVSRAVIDQAKGVLMAVHSCTADEAFAMLVQDSQKRNVKLREVAQGLLDSVVPR